MKKIISIVSVLFLLVSLCGCFGVPSAGSDFSELYNVSETERPSEKVDADAPVATTAPVTEVLNTTAATTVPDNNELPGEYPMEFYFSSGAGGWGTELTLNKDGSFSGAFHDSNLGESGPGYPEGTVYICEFSGKFDNIQQISEYTYSMNMSHLEYKNAVNDEWIENSKKYIASDAYGVSGGNNFRFFLPQTPINKLSDELLSWWPQRFEQENNYYAKLNSYCIYNVDEELAFFSN